MNGCAYSSMYPDTVLLISELNTFCITYSPHNYWDTKWHVGAYLRGGAVSGLDTSDF